MVPKRTEVSVNGVLQAENWYTQRNRDELKETKMNI